MDVRSDIQSAWLGAMQQELGVNASNLMLKDIVIADLERRLAASDELVEALKRRIIDAERAREELRAMVRPPRSHKGRGRADG